MIPSNYSLDELMCLLPDSELSERLCHKVEELQEERALWKTEERELHIELELTEERVMFADELLEEVLTIVEGQGSKGELQKEINLAVDDSGWER